MKPSVIIYSRNGCHLCETAELIARKVLLEIDFDLKIVDISGDAALEKAYGEEVPVTLINGEPHDFLTLNQRRFERALNEFNQNS
jgi:glutaredoxin